MATYTVHIDEQTKEGKQLAKAISDYEDMVENDWLVKKTDEALKSKDYKTIKIKGKASSYLRSLI